MRRTLLVLGCLLLAPGTWTSAEEEPGFVDLAGATVLASPGTPEGLHPFLPGGKAPKPLAWPLPDGPVLVVGLPGTDAAARDLAFFWDLLGPGEDLHGGYLVAAWHDGTRPIGVILGDDAAALHAARFELETAPARRGMQTMDYTQPPAEAGLRMRRGRHTFRPRYRIRAFAPRRDRVSSEAVLAAVAGRANRFWVDVRHDVRRYDPLPPLARHGVPLCIYLPVPSGHEGITARRLAPWTKRGVRHVVLSPAGPKVTTEDVRLHVKHLRSVFDLDEVVISSADNLWVPGTTGTWHPDPARASRISLRRARDAAATAGVPLLFVESWARASHTPVPSRPRGRPAELARLFHGVVVPDGPGAAAVLENAWATGEGTDSEWESVLLPLLPRGDQEPRRFLERTAARLAALDTPTRRAVDWLDPLLGRVRSSLGELHARVVLVPRAPAPVRLDGGLDEPVWGYAPALAFPLPGDAQSRSGTLLALSDGRDLYVALRLPDDVPPMRLVLGSSATGPEPGTSIGDGARADAGATRHTDTTRTWEGVLGHFELAGDAHPTRVLHLWHKTRKGEAQRLASLVLGP